MASAFKNYVPKEQRMAEAIKAVQSGKMSQRAAALKFEVDRSTIKRGLAPVVEINHPETSQSQQGVSSKWAQLSPRERQLLVKRGLTKLCRANNPPAEIFDKKHNLLLSKARGWLAWKGINIPAELNGRVDPYHPPETTTSAFNNPSPQSSSSLGQLHSTDQSHGIDEFDESIGEQYQRVCREVQESGRPSDFKRAIILLTELTEICTKAWYGAFEEQQWNHHDWAHVNSDIKTIQSLVGQRAQETLNECLYGNSEE